MFLKVLLLSAGGAIGALLRYALGGSVHKIAGHHFPFGTLAVNILGCFLIGFFAVLHHEKLVFGPNMRLFFMVGVLGAFTTFSAFSYETWSLMEANEWIKATLNIFLSVGLGMFGLWLGVLLGRLF